MPWIVVAQKLLDPRRVFLYNHLCRHLYYQNIFMKGGINQVNAPIDSKRGVFTSAVAAMVHFPDHRWQPTREQSPAGGNK
jgi:hypothetical protein